TPPSASRCKGTLRAPPAWRWWSARSTELRPECLGTPPPRSWSGRRVGSDDLGLAALFRGIERLVRALEEDRRVVLRLELGDARGEREPSGLADRPRRESCLQTAVELIGIGERRLRENHGELVAAHPAGDIRRADDITDSL